MCYINGHLHLHYLAAKLRVAMVTVDILDFKLTLDIAVIVLVII